MKENNYMLEKDIFKNSSQTFWGVHKGDFWAAGHLGVQMTAKRPAG